jgi:NADH:ubiquinone oxidoreductase subunit 4 (subunit M)
MPVRHFWVPQNAVRAVALCGILLHHILPALQTFGLLIRAVKTSPTLNVTRNKNLKFLEIIKKLLTSLE